MKKITDFLKSMTLVIKWTIGYFFVLWLILRFLFNFDIFVLSNWWKFSHATFHGFPGIAFCIIIYAAIPIYIASAIITYRKNIVLVQIKTPEKIKNQIDKTKQLFTKTETKTVESPAPNEQDPTTTPAFEYPKDMPHELYIPYLRAKQNRPLVESMSSFGKIETPQPTQQIEENNVEAESFPIPTDFDLGDDINDQNDYTFSNNDIPTFKDIDFDIPTTPSKIKKQTSAEKYFIDKNIEYETYKEFIATEKYVIYDHNDGDFWVMDDEKWFASKRQIDSPIPELIDLAHQNGLIPVLYLESQNIMDLPGTTERFENMGVRVVTSLDELE